MCFGGLGMVRVECGGEMETYVDLEGVPFLVGVYVAIW